MPFLIADGTSFALPIPKPTTPWPSPTTTSALKLKFLPPLTTFVTRLIETTVSLSSRSDGSIFSLVSAMNDPYELRTKNSKLQPRLPCRLGDRPDAPVIQIATAIENHTRDAL